MPHILIVEDESSIAETIVYALETEHFQTTHVTTGAEAISLVHDKKCYSLVVLDIGLPDTTGLDVCQQIRKDSGIPILFLTARDSEIDRVLGLEFGADDYVTKPFSPRELVARIKAILRRTSSGSPQERIKHTNEGISIDTDAMTIHCFGKPVALTAHEYKLLATFISQPGRTFTREQLLEHAWDDPGSAMDRTVDAHIKTLRAKLTSASPLCAEVIQTRRGLGYCYHPPQN
ncbi:MAG: two-component system response regulator CreB [Akkermansiaceae bacterium]